MAKPLKITLYLISSLIILLIIAVVIITTVINPNDFKGVIARTTSKQLNREVTINGNLSWSFFPWLGIKVHDVTVANRIGFNDKPLAEIGEADIKVKLLPLLHKKLEMEKVLLKNCALAWNNPQNGQQVKLQNLNLQISQFSFHTPFKLATDFDFTTVKPDYSGKIKLSGLVTINPNQKIYGVSNLSLTGRVNTLAVKLSGAISADLTKQVMEGKNLQLQSNGTKLQLDIKGKNIITKPSYSGAVTLNATNLNSSLAAVGVKFRNKNALRKVALQAKFTATPDVVTIPTIKAKIDNSILQGKVSKIELQKKITMFSVTVDRLNLNSYQLSTTKKKAKKVKAKAASGKKTAKAAKVKPWQVDGGFEIGYLQLHKFALSSVSGKLKLSNNILRLVPLQASLYGGSLYSTLRLNLQRNTPSYAINGQLKNINVQRLLKAAANMSRITGTANLKARLSAWGSSNKTILRSLNGSGALNLYNGTYQGINISYVLRRAGALIKQQKPPSAPKRQETRFGRVTGTFAIRNGLLSNNDLKVESSGFRVRGKGTAHLATESLNYQIRAANLKRTNRTVREEPVFVPIRVTGSFSNPRFVPDFAYVIKTFATSALKNIVIGVPKSGVNVGKQLGKVIGNLFKR